jgi:hypothetical protein
MILFSIYMGFVCYDEEKEKVGEDKDNKKWRSKNER